MHSCGKVERLIPCMVETAVDFWESAQMDIKDLPALKVKKHRQIEC